MKVMRLDLLAFGPFTNGRIDFSKKERALQLVYGPNEAGKSTTLRALLALLYGIPARTEDAHLHEMARLRVGGSFQDARGRIVQLTRRKGLKNTLLDATGQPLDESVLNELLHGIDETMFRNMFGLDHDRLRAGSEALLQASGNLGEGLFSASIGTRTVRDLKEALSGEAEALFKPRGKTPKLNLVLESLREKLKQKRDDALSPSTYAEQTKALDAGEAQRARQLVERRALLTERAELTRKLAWLLPLAKHAALKDELAALTHRATVAPAAERLGAEAHDTLPEERIRELERRYGVMLSAEAELPELKLEIARLSEEESALRMRLGSAAQGAQRVDTPLRTRLRRLSEEASVCARKQSELERAALLLSAELSASRAGAPQAEAHAESAIDAAWLEGIERENLLVLRERAEQDCARRAALVARAAAQLGYGSQDTSADIEPLMQRLSCLVLPEESELSELERSELAIERDSERASEKKAQLEAQRLRFLRARGELLVDGELSTLAELSAARSARDDTLASLLEKPAPEAVARFRAQLAHTDELADKLRREAGLSHELARIDSEERVRVAEESALARELLQLEERRQRHQAEATHALSPLGVTRASTRGLRAKLAKLEALRATAAEGVLELATRASLRKRAAQLAQALAAQLGEQVVEGGADATQLDALLARLSARVLEAKKAEHEESERQKHERELNARLDANRSELLLLQAAEQAARTQLASELSTAGFAAQLSHDEVLACLDELTLLHERERQLALLLARKQTTEAQAARLREDVAEAVKRFVPGAETLSLSEQLAALARSERTRREASRDQSRLGAELEKLETELFALGDGASLETLRARVSGLDPNAARARLFEVDTQVAALEEEIGALDQKLGGLKAGMSRLLEAPFAVQVAEDVEAELGNARALLRRYVEVKLSLTVLSREVERHRQKHQDPMLLRASALFSRLTLGRYTGLSAELDERDEPFLCARHKTGKTVRIQGLSDGTRDQLYLALRIASVERFVLHSTALPLVLDDAFIHFDDARATAALSVLGELSEKTQVLFFTHHARMIELAKIALKPSQLAVHELDPVRGTVAFRDNGPLFADA